MAALAHTECKHETELQRLRTLYQLLESLMEASSVLDVYETALTSLLEATNADRAAILMFDDDGMMRFKAWRGLSSEYRQAVTGHTPWTRGARNVQPVLVPDALREKDLHPFHEALAREKIGAVGFIPLALADGVFGNLMLYYAEPHEYEQDEVAIAQAIAGHVAIAAERAHGERERARSEQRLQAILDNSTTVIFMKDGHGRFLLINRRFEELFHLTQAQVVGQTDYAIFPPEVADQLTRNDRKMLTSGRPLSVEERIPQADGVHTYLSVKFPMEGVDGAPAGICGIATDITDRKRLEIASRRLAAIVETSEDAIVSEDLDGNIANWNKGAERIFGYTAEEAIGKSISMLAPPGRREQTAEVLRRVEEGIRVDPCETSRMRKDGRMIDVALTISPVLDDSGRIVGASEIARDITARKRSEEERASLLLREQEARKTAELLNLMGPRLLAELNPEKLVQAVTDIATLLTGARFGAFFRAAEDATKDAGCPYALSGMSPEEFAEYRISEIPVPLDIGTIRSDDISQDGRLTQSREPPDLAPSLRSYLRVAVESRSGESLGALVFGHSSPARFTETHEAILAGIAAHAAIAMDNARLFEQAGWIQTELKRSNQELRRANQDLETFAYSASHDLLEPLRTIALSAEVLERDIGPTLRPGESAFLKRIMTAAHGMNSLLEDLLAYIRIAKSADGPPPQVSSADTLDRVLESLDRIASESGLTVTRGDLPVVLMHETQLVQILQNLITNSVKYRGKESPRVHVSAAQYDAWTVFSVSDNGIGIDPQYAEQIFGLFKRLHSRDRYPGSGIGLAICERIVEQYGGRIWLKKSAPHAGSTFCFSVPASRRRETGGSIGESKHAPASENPPPGGQ